MARITTNTTGTEPILILATAVSGNLTVGCLQDVTITNSTGVYSYTSYCSPDMQKLTTPADNSISTNIVIDRESFFGNSAATAGSAAYLGILGLSGSKTPFTWNFYWAGNATATTDILSSGTGFITGIASKVSPDAPVWVTPVNIAVDGAITTIQTG
jgi:hypothetical protein